MALGPKQRIAWFSPVTGPSVSAYATMILLPILGDQFEITVFHNGPPGICAGGLPVDHYLNAVVKDQVQPYDIFFYNLEDSRELDFARIHLALKPGIVWFHDFFMTTHGPEPILNSSWSETVKHFKDAGREWPERGREFAPRGVIAEREAAMSVVPLFSNARDLAESKRLVADNLSGEHTVRYLLHHPVGEAVFRNSMRDIDTAVIGVCGRPRVESHIHQLFTALQDMRFTGKLVWPVVADERMQAEALLEEFGLKAQCQLVNDLGPQTWESVVSSISVAIHLKYSAFGQPSPFLPLSLAAGLPALVTDFASGAIYPENVVFKIQPGRYEVAEIAKVLETILYRPVLSVPVTARAYAEEFHHPQAIATQLAQILTFQRNQISNFQARWRQLERIAYREVVAESLAAQSSRSDDSVLVRYLDGIKAVYDELGWFGAGH